MEARLFGISVLEFYLKDDLSLGIALIERDLIKIQNNKPFVKIKDKDFELKEPRFFIIENKPVLLKLIWIVFAKHFVLSHYLKFSEFLGVPPLIANASSGDEKLISLMADALENLKSGGYAVLGANDIVKVLEGHGSQADFLEFVRYCDAEIAKVINGSVLSSNALGSSGSYAMSKTHDENRKEILADDMKFASREVENIYAKFGKKAKLNIQIEKDTDLLARAQTLQILYSMGYKMSAQDISKEFDLPILNDDVLKQENSIKNRPLNLDRFDAAINSLEFQAVQKNSSKRIKDRLNALLSECESYEEVFERLQDEFKDFNILEREFTNAIANAQLYGSDI